VIFQLIANPSDYLYSVFYFWHKKNLADVKNTMVMFLTAYESENAMQILIKSHNIIYHTVL